MKNMIFKLEDCYMTYSLMTGTKQKEIRTYIMLEQAKKSINEYQTFIANLDAFVSAARNITFVMQKEFKHVPGFEDWYKSKVEYMSKNPEFAFFNQLRVDTTHVKPFPTASWHKTTIDEKLVVRGGSTVGIPLIKTEDGKILPDDKSPLIINDKFVNPKRSTINIYYFTDKPDDDALIRCEKYYQELSEMVIECHEKFKLS
jgi:hypothetical protein